MIYALKLAFAGSVGSILGKWAIRLFIGLMLLPFIPFPLNLPVMMLV